LPSGEKVYFPQEREKETRKRCTSVSSEVKDQSLIHDLINALADEDRKTEYGNADFTAKEMHYR